MSTAVTVAPEPETGHPLIRLANSHMLESINSALAAISDGRSAAILSIVGREDAKGIIAVRKTTEWKGKSFEWKAAVILEKDYDGPFDFEIAAGVSL